jgi:hypothetical protein
MLKALLVVLAVTSVATKPVGARPQANCGKLDKQSLAQHAPKDWQSLYRLFKQFGACDDGAIGEQFSEDVAQLFSKQWTHLDKLNRLATTDKAFEQFVLRHIDTTLDENELLAIADNSKVHCPVGEKRICGLIHARAQESLDTIGNVIE